MLLQWELTSVIWESIPHTVDDLKPALPITRPESGNAQDLYRQQYNPHKGFTEQLQNPEL